MDYMQKLKALMLAAAKQGVSDLHLAVGRRPILRIDGKLIDMPQAPILTPEDTQGLAMAMLTDKQKEQFISKGDLDFSYNFEDKARFRVNVFFQKGFMAAALRLIPAEIKTIEDLALPNILHEFARC